MVCEFIRRDRLGFIVGDSGGGTGEGRLILYSFF